MLLTICAGLVGSFLGSLLSAVLISRYLVHNHLIPEKSAGILKASAPRMFKRQEKRVPRANTDLMAYQKELKEQGENRG